MPRLKPLFFALAVVALAGFVVVELNRELSTPEERVRWALEDAVDNFNDRQADRLMRLFAGEFEDEEGGYDRDDVREAMHVMLWFGEHDYEVELHDALLEIDVAEDGKRAEVDLGFAFWRDEEKEAAPWWDLRAQVDFERKGSQWKIVRSRGVNHDERGR